MRINDLAGYLEIIYLWLIGLGCGILLQKLFEVIP